MRQGQTYHNKGSTCRRFISFRVDSIQGLPIAMTASQTSKHVLLIRRMALDVCHLSTEIPSHVRVKTLFPGKNNAELLRFLRCLCVGTGTLRSQGPSQFPFVLVIQIYPYTVQCIVTQLLLEQCRSGKVYVAQVPAKLKSSEKRRNA